MIRLIEATNPLQPSVGRVIREIEHEEGRTLEELLAWKLCRLDIDESEGAQQQFDKWASEAAVSVNGKLWERSLWCLVEPRDGDCVVCTPKLGNGSLLRTLASVAVMAASIAATALLGPAGIGLAMLGMSSTLTASVIAGAVSLAGNILISAFMGTTPSNKAETPSYAFDGPHSLAQSGSVIPKGYGTMRWGGNIIASFIDIEGPDQYLNVLACFGFGPARAITGLQLNGKDVSEYQNVQYYVRYGANVQTPLPNFNRVVNGYPQATQCLAGIPVIVPGTGTLTQILQVDIQFPDGLYVITKDGNQVPIVMTWLVEYSVSGAGAWQPVVQPTNTSDVVTYDPITGLPNTYPTWCAVATDLPPSSGVVYATDSGSHQPGDPYTATQSITVFDPTGGSSTISKTVQGEWQLTDPQLNQVLVTQWSAGYQNFLASDESPLYFRTNIYGLTPGKYDVRVTKYGSGQMNHPVNAGDNFASNVGQDMWVHSVNEVSLLDLSYPNMILIGVRALATGQLAGSNLDVSALIQHGLRTLDNNILPGALQAFEEDNPACVAADMALDGLYGGGQAPGINAENILRFIDEWVAWAELNDQLVDDGNGGSIRRHVFNGVFDNESNLWDQMSVVGRMSRAVLIPLGRDYGVFLDQPDTSCQIFSVGNIVQDSFSETWMAIDDRANQVEIQFADSTRFYKQDNPIAYMDPANQDSGVAIKNVRIDGKGITIPAQAWHLARFKERCNQFLLRTGSFKCDTEAIACRPGNVIILQHDVPQWGWGGRTLPGSTTISILVDRSDLPFVGGTSYSMVVLFPSIARYTGTITTANAVLDPTGASLGIQLNLSSFDNSNRVTRCVIVVSGVTYDFKINTTVAGYVIVDPLPGFTPIAGQAYTLYDTDVLETATVTAATATTVTLGTPFSQAPNDYSTYFYGPVGAQKLARVVTVRKASEFRSTIDWIDYDDNVYVDATPVIGETSAQSFSNPGITNLTGQETIKLIAGSYIPYASLSWTNGPDTAGVSIYALYSSGVPTSNPVLPQMIARLTNLATSWQQQIPVGVGVTYIVVGFDVNNDYASFQKAPRVTILGEGITNNLLLGSSFSTGFAYWSITPRAGDTLVPDLSNDGEATYTVAGAALTTAQTLLYQLIPQSKWAIGDYLMLSAYFEDSAVSTANVGQLIVRITFLDSSGATISSVDAPATLNGVAPTLTRVNTASTQIPTGTVQLAVQIVVGGSGLSIQVGSVLTFSHLLLEESTSGQTIPSLWSDRDVQGAVLDYFTTGSSSGLRAQGSVLPAFTGNFSVTLASIEATFSWTGLVIAWPDGGFTYVADGILPSLISLAPSTTYYVYLYFDVISGSVKFVQPASPAPGVDLAGPPFGIPGYATLAYDPLADAACQQDGRVSLTAGGLQFTMPASGTVTAPGGGGVHGGPISPITPPL